MTSRGLRGAARALAIAGPAAAGAYGLAAPDRILTGGLAWLGFVLAALAGWGHAVERLCGTRTDAGLRLAWGTAAILGAAGWLLAFGALDRSALLALLAIGFALFAWGALTSAEPALVGAARRLRATVRDPQAAILWTLLLAIAAIGVLRAVARVHGNPYDDDAAYTPMVKRLLDCGDLDEPFSFRRLSAYGGQTVLGALVAARGTLANLYLADHGVAQLVTLALLVGLLRRQRPLDPYVAGLILLATLLLPDAATNTASYWTGAALFLGLYRTVVDADRLARGGWAVVGAVAAGACALRQNYLPVALLFPVLAIGLRLRRPLAPSLRAQRFALRDLVLGGAVVLLPYLLASWRSSHTLLYPLFLGTGNPHAATTPLVWSLWQELQFFLQVALDPNPVRVMVPLVPVVLLCRDRRPGAPLFAFTLACALGFALTVHAFTLSDTRNLWRYAFGYATVLALVVATETSARGLGDDDDAPVRVPVAGRVIVVICLLAQFAYTGKTTLAGYKALAAELSEAQRTRRDAAADIAVPALYQRLQASVPAGAPLVALLDDAAYLDYARNRIVNLDTPGFASAGPGLPMFAGAEAKAAYFRSQRLRYLAFVRGDASRYFYRRGEWLDRVFRDTELWRIVAAYQLDTLDSFAELATRYPVRFDEAGLVVVDLGPPRPGERAGAGADEDGDRERFVKALAAREGLTGEWLLTSRGDLVFEDGWSALDRLEPEPTVPVRWIGTTAHARLRGRGADMHLRIWGRVDRGALATRPRVTLVVDGIEIGSRLVADDGAFTLETVIPASWVADWTDLYLSLSSVGEPLREPAKVRAARVEGVLWQPVP